MMLDATIPPQDVMWKLFFTRSEGINMCPHSWIMLSSAPQVAPEVYLFDRWTKNDRGYIQGMSLGRW